MVLFMQALRLVDPSGVVLEKVCGPVREYLYHRDDTVRCIVASLTTDCDSDLAEVSAHQSLMTVSMSVSVVTLLFIAHSDAGNIT